MKELHVSGVILLICSISRAAAPSTAPASAPTSRPAPMDSHTTVISFPVPGSTADAQSKAMVVLPRAYDREDEEAASARRYPVVYLLHGFAASHLRYHEKVTEAGKSLTDLADRFGAILVMPDGGCCSWYLNAPADVPGAADWQYETIIVEHVIPEIDRHYRTWTERAGRAISGISMGGHGAIYLSSKHPDLFAAASSMSGVMDLRETLNPSPLAARIGTFEQHRARWTNFSVLAHADRLVNREVAILLDCGWDDPFIWGNRALHDKLMHLKVDHDYIERPGRHEWKYWINALPYHLQFLTDRLKPAGPPRR